MMKATILNLNAVHPTLLGFAPAIYGLVAVFPWNKLLPQVLEIIPLTLALPHKGRGSIFYFGSRG